MGAMSQPVSRHRRYILDSSALAIYLSNGQGWEEISPIVDAARAKQTAIYVTTFSLSELLADQERTGGAASAQTTWARIQKLPFKLTDIDRTLALAAAHIRALYSLEQADPFAAALAERQHAVLLTSNGHYRKIEKLVAIKWLPTGSSPEGPSGE